MSEDRATKHERLPLEHSHASHADDRVAIVHPPLRALGSRPKSPLTTVRYAILNIARWSILAGMLTFLLTAILALHEALNFQDRVLELAGNDRDRARRVLGVLHETLENPDSYPEDRELPYASIAVKLDRLSKVQETLTGFVIPPPPPAEVDPSGLAVAGGAAPSGQASKEMAATGPKAQWKSASNRLKLSIADLDDTLKTGDPSRKLVEALDLTRQHIQALSAFEGTIETSVDDTKRASFGVAHAAEVNGELVKKENRFQLQLVAAELADGLARIEDRVTTSPEDDSR